MNKSLATNIIAVLLSILGILTANEHIKALGFYALSGALTNWLAVIMLFDKIPFIYGSGVIPKQFAAFKLAIKNMMLRQFFHHDNIEKFLLNALKFDGKLLKNKLTELVDYDLLFDRFIDAIMSSQFGTMIDTFLGGREALGRVPEPSILYNGSFS